MTNDRRSFLQLAGASAALVAAEACTLGPTDEKIVPYVRETPEVTPGKPSIYATALAHNGYARPVLATTYAGRPVKIDGNDDHPSMLGGGSTTFEQASLLDLYSDGRKKHVEHDHRTASVSALADFIAGATGPVTVVLEATTSPTVARLVAELEAKRPQTRVFFTGQHATRIPVYDFSGIEVVASFASDALDRDPLAVRYSRQIGEARRARYSPCRIYAVEPKPRDLGMLADHRYAARPSLMQRMLASLARAMQLTGENVTLDARANRFVQALASDLQASQANAILLCAADAPSYVHDVVAAINAQLAPERIRWIDAGLVGTPEQYDRAALLSSLPDSTVVVIGGNPARTVPGFADTLARSKTSITFGLFPNTTSARSSWSAPLAHPFETWMDLHSGDGQLSLAQPLVRPLFGSLGLIDVLGLLCDPTREPPQGFARAEVRTTFGSIVPKQTFETALRSGFVHRPVKPQDAPDVDTQAIERAVGTLKSEVAPDDAIELCYDDFDGIHNAWLLEMPQRVTSLTWDNAVHISEATARALDVTTGDVLRINDLVELPAVVMPGHADGAVTVQRGWGEVSAATGTLIGADVSPLGDARTAKLVKTGRHTALAFTQHTYEHRESVTRTASRKPSLVPRAPKETHESLHDAHPGTDGKALGGLLGKEQWGMSVDMNSCSGCGACTVACQAENNIPVVGKSGVLRNRHMNWLRINTVLADNSIVQQPMLCQHCEAAPCEYVCPVNATTHSPDGINEMTYNRCVGTRFCSNNCPYKVRRFNWYDFTRDTPPVTQLAYNPNVTVRARGVMEKCTFCVQRVRRAGIDARLKGRGLITDEVTTACAQACPTGAIVFGNIADRNAQVTHLHARADAYEALGELGTRPRVRYLPRVLNRTGGLDQ